ncbi:MULTISPECIES: pyridoxamine 5'-phosphate oxidase family protein [Rhodococcus]|uniref:Pyridoxamine 5'-phosphate oxidase family protein n=1 Tax=Rhodococcus parequi TaxID=3137122 RepID=A0ABW9FJZ2_9NOCA
MAGYRSSATIPDAAAALIDAPEFATLATVEPGGQPQLSVVWLERDGDDIDKLAQKYTGAERWEHDTPDTPRVIVRLTPAKVIWKG